VNALADSLIHSRDWKGISEARLETEQFNESAYIDLFDFASKIQFSVSDSAVQKAVKDLPDFISRTVISSKSNSTHPNARGISIYFPVGGKLDENYARHTLNTSKWKDFLTQYLEANR
jgi:hypothetical protein